MLELLATKFEYKSSFDDITYEFSPLTLGNLADFCLWFQYKELHDFKYNASQYLDADIRKEMQKELYKKCASKTYKLDDPEIAASMMTCEGIIQQLCLSLKRKHPDMTYDKVQEIIPIDDLNHVIKNVYRISGLGPATDDEKEEDEILGES